jgi:hypothetical protein
MNTKSLTKHYASLTPWERVPLILAAIARKDDLEADRLGWSAPRVLFKVANHYGLEEGLECLAGFYLMNQLDLVACYQEALTCSMEGDLLYRGREWREHHDLFWNAARILAYRFLVLVDAWKLMCTELQIDPAVLIRDLPGYDTLCRQEAAMRLIAFSAEEAFNHFRKVTEGLAKKGTPQENRRDYRIDTMEEVINGWRRFLAKRAERWM